MMTPHEIGGALNPAEPEDCAAFQARLAQLYESQSDLESEAHLKSCERCAELVRDLQYIAEQAKLLMPIHDPSPKVWSNIQREIVNSEGSR